MKSFSSECKSCMDLCITHCPSNAIKRNDLDKIIFDDDVCIYCGLCSEICPEKIFENRRSEKKPSSFMIMKPKRGHVGIIGGGTSGVRAANQLVCAGFSVTLFSEDRFLIERSLLCSQFSDTMNYKPHSVKLHPDVHVQLGSRVEAINSECEVFTNNSKAKFNSLIIATGSKNAENFQLFDKSTIFNFKDYDQICSLVSLIKSTKPKNAIVIGGGCIGIEASVFLSRFGLSIRIFEKGSGLLNGALDELIENEFDRLLSDNNISYEFDTEIASVSGNEIVTTKGNSHTADIIVNCSGVVPDVTLCGECGIKYNRGIVVDASLKTSADHIYALGDVTEFNGQCNTTIDNAIAQAIVCVNVLSNSGKANVFKPVPKCTILKNVPGNIIVAGNKSGKRIVRKLHNWLRVVYVNDSDCITGFQMINDKDGISGILYNAMKNGVKVDPEAIYYGGTNLNYYSLR